MAIVPMEGELESHYGKANFFRVIHVDGAIGAVSPGNKMIHMSVFSERSPVPVKMVQRVSNGILGEEIAEKRVSKRGVFREVEADLVLSVDTAIAVRNWLDEKIQQAQSALQEPNAEQGPSS